MPTSTETQQHGHEVDAAPVIDAVVLRRERELSDRWKPDWHNARRTDPPVPRATANHELGLVTITLSHEEIEAILPRLRGTIVIPDPLVEDVISMLVGALPKPKPADVAPAAWGVR